MNDMIKAKIADWALSGTTGASASSIAAHIGGVGKASGDYPHDSGDFGRCERLLDMVPELRQDFAKMAAVNDYWAALVPKWVEIKATKGDAQTAMIRSVVRPLEGKDKGLIRIGGNVTMRFGRL